MIQNILALTIVFIAAGISVYATVRSLISKKGGHCDGCTACGTTNSQSSKTSDVQHIDYKNLVFEGKGN